MQRETHAHTRTIFHFWRFFLNCIFFQSHLQEGGEDLGGDSGSSIALDSENEDSDEVEEDEEGEFETDEEDEFESVDFDEAFVDGTE
jgi:hypothetical protein